MLEPSVRVAIEDLLREQSITQISEVEYSCGTVYITTRTGKTYYISCNECEG